MQPRTEFKKIQLFFEAFLSKNKLSKSFVLLFIFLLAVLLISFVIPYLHFGRFFGTDDYSHLYHTNVMESSLGMSDFYNKIGTQVSNPSSGINDYNYPFGVWLFGATIAKITSVAPVNIELLFVILFLCIIFVSFYVYSGIWLESKEQRIMAVLFLLSMPSAAVEILAYRPSVFILPFLFILIYIALKEPVKWKLFPIVWLSIFVIALSHTGTLIFLIIFSILFFFLYCLIWGRFSYSMYIVVLSTFVIYILSLSWFPEIANQYDAKSTLILSPGNFLAAKFNFSLPLELGNIVYQNMIVNHEFSYTIILGAFIFALGKLFIYVHRKVSETYSQSKYFYPITLPISNISHSFTSAPLWIGPLHVIFSILGFFRIDSKGKCMLITALLVTILPDMLQTAQGALSATGATREISYLVLIIPVTTAIGFWAVISYLDTTKYSHKKFISLMVWVLVLLAIILPPTLATTYYLPRISGEDYIIDGMKWLGNTGDLREKVVAYGYRTAPIYTNMTDAAYGIQDGSESTNFFTLLRGIYFSSGERNVDDLRHYFGARYILTSDKLAENLKGSPNSLTIDNNQALDKTYSSKDFGIYEVITSSEKPAVEQFIAENISLQQTGSSIQIQTDVYKVVLNADYPIIERFGTPQNNYLGDGFIAENILIYGLRQNSNVNPYLPLDNSAGEQNSTVDKFYLNNVKASHNITDNQITYRTILKDQQNGNNEASLLVRYTFYPTTIKREFMISNDWIAFSDAPQMNVYFQTKMFVPLNDFIMKDDKTLIKRHIYPSQDAAVLNGNFQDIYLYNGGEGIDLKSEQTAPYPFELAYAGSTLYNMSILSLSQADSIKPGATLHVTQFLSPGDEITADRNIMTQEGISLVNYPDGMIPIMLSGYGTAYPNILSGSTIEQGYQVLQDENIPYSEIIVPGQESNIPGGLQNSTILTNETVKINTIKIVGSGNTGSRVFDNFSSQESSISSMIDYANNKGITLIGYMPGSLNYNLDTLKIISDKKIPFIFSGYILPPYYGLFGKETRDPQMASYQSDSLDVTLFPVSYPLSSDLSSKVDNNGIFSAWKASIDEAAANDKMTLFIIRSEDIGNPSYTEDFKKLLIYAKNKGLTFTTPDVIANHLKNIQNIQYSGSINGDKATIHLINNNDDLVQGVSFRIMLPSLKKGNYSVSDGNVVKTELENNHMIVYVSTDISPHATKEITIEPSAPREKMVVTMPLQPVEGQTTISIKDPSGYPLKNAEAIIDSKYYFPDANGNVNVDLNRGVHNIQIHCAGYEPYTSTFTVKGRIYLIGKFFGVSS